MKEDVKPIEYYKGIFDIYKKDPDLYNWGGWQGNNFVETMWGLGYELLGEEFGLYKSNFPLNVKEPSNEHERRKNDLYYLEHAPRQIVGNYLFSFWRFYTHWSLYGYSDYDVNYLNRVINILESKYEEEPKKSIYNYAKSLGYSFLAPLGETDTHKYYIVDKNFLDQDNETEEPIVFEVYIPTQTFTIYDSYNSLDIVNRFNNNRKLNTMTDDVKSIVYHKGIFDVFKDNPLIEYWHDANFPEIMWGLGFEMDCEHSYEEYVKQSPLKVKKPHSEREEKKNTLYYLEHAPRQIVGNYLFSHWRYLTHWAYYGPNKYDVDYLNRIIIILENKYEEEK